MLEHARYVARRKKEDERDRQRWVAEMKPDVRWVFDIVSKLGSVQTRRWRGTYPVLKLLEYWFASIEFASSVVNFPVVLIMNILLPFIGDDYWMAPTDCISRICNPSSTWYREYNVMYGPGQLHSLIATISIESMSMFSMDGQVTWYVSKFDRWKCTGCEMTYGSCQWCNGKGMQAHEAGLAYANGHHSGSIRFLCTNRDCYENRR